MKCYNSHQPCPVSLGSLFLMTSVCCHYLLQLNLDMLLFVHLPYMLYKVSLSKIGSRIKSTNQKKRCWPQEWIVAATLEESAFLFCSLELCVNQKMMADRASSCSGPSHQAKSLVEGSNTIQYTKCSRLKY